MEKLVSVLMPCYNHENYVAESIDSILNQTYDNIELLIVENGSTDNSREVIKKYEGNSKVRIYYFDKNDCEKAQALLASEAQGDYWAQATSDDIWMPDKLEKQMKVLSENPDIDVCTSWAMYCDENMCPNNSFLDAIFAVSFEDEYKMLRHLWENGNCICAPSSVGKKEALKIYYEKPVVYWQLNDYEGWLILLLNGMKIHIYPEVLVKMREHGNAISFSEGCTNRYAQEIVSLNVSTIEVMSSGMYKKVFFDQLVNKNAHSDEEILCEKILLLFRYAAGKKKELNMLVTDFFYRYYASVKETFESVYGLDREYFGNIITKVGYNAIANEFYKQGVQAVLDKIEQK